MRISYPHARGEQPILRVHLSWDANSFEYAPSLFEPFIEVTEGSEDDGWMVLEVRDRIVMEEEELVLYFRATVDADTGSFRARASVLSGDE